MIELSVEDLHLDYGDNPVLKGVSMQLRQGEVVSLLGPSGSGKTTLLRAVAGLEGPKRGRITIGDRVVYDGGARKEIPAEERNLGLVFQSYALWPHKTVFENVAYPLKLRKVPSNEVRERVQAVLDQLGLGKLGQRHPHALSGGQQQRVAIGRALVYSPPVILLDEPLSNLDAKLREEMQLELRSIQRTVGTTTILVTHDQSEALALSDRIVVMNQGRVEQVADPFEAYEGPASHFVGGFLGKANVFTPTAQPFDGETRARIGEAHIPMDGLPVPQGAVIVRPEKILFADAGACALPGRMKTRVFQGNHWLCQVETSVGEVMVIRQNDGVPVPAEGQPVHLRWRAQDMCLVAGKPTP